MVFATKNTKDSKFENTKKNILGDLSFVSVVTFVVDNVFVAFEVQFVFVRLTDLFCDRD